MADVHLDTPFRGISQSWPHLAEELSQATVASFDHLVGRAIEERVDFVIIAGDLYDSREHSMRARLQAHRQFDRLADHGIRVYLAHGNHDPWDPGGMRWPQNVHVFPAGRVGRFTAFQGKDAIAEIQGMSYPESAVKENWVPQFVPESTAPFHIAVLHANVDGQPGHDNYAPARLSEMIQSGFDYWALGHVHTRQVLSAHPWVVYPGNTQGRHILESGIKGAYLVSVDDRHGVSLDFEPASRILWQTIRIEGRSVPDEGALVRVVGDALDQLDAPLPVIVRIEVQEPSERLARELMRAEDRQAFLRQWIPNVGQSSWTMVADIVFRASAVNSAFEGTKDFWSETLRQLDRLMDDEEALLDVLRPLFARPSMKGLRARLIGEEGRTALRESTHSAVKAWIEGEG